MTPYRPAWRSRYSHVTRKPGDVGAVEKPLNGRESRSIGTKKANRSFWFCFYSRVFSSLFLFAGFVQFAAIDFFNSPTGNRDRYLNRRF